MHREADGCLSASRLRSTTAPNASIPSRRSPQDGPRSPTPVRRGCRDSVPGRWRLRSRSVSSGLCSANPTIRKRVRRAPGQFRSRRTSVNVRPWGETIFAQVCGSGFERVFDQRPIGFPWPRGSGWALLLGPGDVAITWATCSPFRLPARNRYSDIPVGVCGHFVEQRSQQLNRRRVHWARSAALLDKRRRVCGHRRTTRRVVDRMAQARFGTPTR